MPALHEDVEQGMPPVVSLQAMLHGALLVPFFSTPLRSADFLGERLGEEVVEACAHVVANCAVLTRRGDAYAADAGQIARRINGEGGFHLEEEPDYIAPGVRLAPRDLRRVIDWARILLATGYHAYAQWPSMPLSEAIVAGRVAPDDALALFEECRAREAWLKARFAIR